MLQITGTASMEMIAGGAALLFQIAYLNWYRKVSIRSAACITLLTVPALYFSLESMNSFLTFDETYMIYEPADLMNNSLIHWSYGAFRTTNLFVGIPIAGIKLLTGFSIDILAVFAKSLHWFLSFALISIIAHRVVAVLDAPNNRALHYFLALNMVLLFPAVLLAQKIINYDAFSMLFGVLSVLFLMTGWKAGHSYYLYVSIILAAFAAQEKLIASPLLLANLIAIPLRIGVLRKGHTLHSLLNPTLQATVLSAVAVFSVFSLTHILISLVNKSGAPANNAFLLFLPLLNGLWPILRIAGVDFANWAAHPFFAHWSSIALFAAMACIMLINVNTLGALLVNLFIRIPSFMHLNSFMLRRVQIANYALFCGLYLVGIACTYGIKAYLAPYHPVPPGAYQGYSFNKAFVHFGASSFLSHLTQSTGWVCAVLSNSIPTVFFVIAIINCSSVIAKGRKGGFLHEAIFTCALIAPLFYGILQVPVCSRYLNMFLLITVIKLASDFIQGLIDGRRATIIATACVIMLVLEIIPFRPLFGSFRPLWSNYSSSYNRKPCRAVLNPWWMGWGEEVYLGGKRILKHIRNENPKLDGVKIYSNYPGDWLYRKNNAQIIQIDTAKHVTYSKNDYFIVTRFGITQSSMNFPEGIRPFDVVSFRGFTQAWIFRGSELAQAGFEFKNGIIDIPQ